MMKYKALSALMMVLLFVALTGCGEAVVTPGPEDSLEEQPVPAWKKLMEKPADLPDSEVFAGMRIAVLLSPSRYSQLEFEGIFNNLAENTDAQLIVTTSSSRVLTLTNQKTGETHTAVNITDLDPLSLNALAIVGGGGVDLLYEDKDVHHFLQTMAADNRILASVCGGSNVIATAGLVVGRKVAGHEFYSELLEKHGSGYAPDPILVDGNFITAQAGRERDLVWAMMRVLGAKGN